MIVCVCLLSASVYTQIIPRTVVLITLAYMTYTQQSKKMTEYVCVKRETIRKGQRTVSQYYSIITS